MALKFSVSQLHGICRGVEINASRCMTGNLRPTTCRSNSPRLLLPAGIRADGKGHEPPCKMDARSPAALRHASLLITREHATKNTIPAPRCTPISLSKFRSLSNLGSINPTIQSLFIVSKRTFHSSRPNQDVFFVTVPAFKQALLTLIRVTLICVPFAWRWGFFKKFPRGSRPLWQLPLAAFCLVLALGLSQSPRTHRWRLLLMSEREELEWSNQRFDELISAPDGMDGGGGRMTMLPPDDPRVEPVRRVCSRLIKALQQETPISCAQFPREETLEKVLDKRQKVVPSCKTEDVAMPFLPESSNPEKRIPSSAWDVYVVDYPKINAFVLPSTDIFVYSGLLSVVEGNEDLLAAVLAHELIHVTERHSVEALGFLALSGVVFDIARGASWALFVSFPMVGDALSTFFTFLDRKVGHRAYSRKLETEADALGLELMARAGYDPRAALELWEVLNEVEKDVSESGESTSHGITAITDHIALLRTHPTGEQRLEAIKSLLPAAIKIFDKAKADEKYVLTLLKEKAKLQEAEAISLISQPLPPSVSPKLVEEKLVKSLGTKKTEETPTSQIVATSN